MSLKDVQELAEAVGGSITEVGRLPDGSGFAMMSMPLPKDHWSTRQTGYEPPPMPFLMGTDDPGRQIWADKIRAAGRYAYRSATMQGKEPDLDPDALIQNLVVGMLGYWTPNGLSEDEWANPLRPTGPPPTQAQEKDPV
jgi:hypothetical protein